MADLKRDFFRSTQINIVGTGELNSQVIEILPEQAQFQSHYPPSFRFMAKKALVINKKSKNVENFSSLKGKNIFSPISEFVPFQTKNRSETKSKFILPAYALLKSNTSIYKSNIKASNVNPMDETYVLKTLKEINTNHHPHKSIKKISDDKAFTSLCEALKGVSDIDVKKLYIILKSQLAAGAQKQQILLVCSPYLSREIGARQNFLTFLDSIPQLNQQIQPKQTTKETPKRTETRMEILMASFAALASELQSNVEPPPQVELPKFEPRVLESNPQYKTTSYFKYNLPLVSRACDALLFNSQYICVASGSEGGSGDKVVDEQMLRDMIEYFQSTMTIPDNEVKINRMEKCLAHLIQGPPSDLCRFPGYVVAAMKDVYGPAGAQTVMDLLNNHPKAANAIAQTIAASCARFYDLEPAWNAFHAYQNAFMQRVWFFKPVIPPTEVPAFVTFDDKKYSQIEKLCEVALETQNIENAAVATFFRIIRALATEPKRVAFFPRLFLSALRLIDCIYESLDEFNASLERCSTDEYCFLAKMQAMVSEFSSKGVAPENSPPEERFVASDAPLGFKLLVMHLQNMRGSRPGKGVIDVVFGTLAGHHLFHTVQSLLSVLEMFNMRSCIIPLARAFELPEKERPSENDYIKMALELCPGRQLYTFKHGDGGIMVNAMKELRPPVVVPIQYLIPKDIGKKDS